MNFASTIRSFNISMYTIFFAHEVLMGRFLINKIFSENREKICQSIFSMNTDVRTKSELIIREIA